MMDVTAVALVVLLASDMGDCVDDESLIQEVIQSHPEDYNNEQKEG